VKRFHFILTQAHGNGKKFLLNNGSFFETSYGILPSGFKKKNRRARLFTLLLYSLIFVFFVVFFYSFSAIRAYPDL